MANMNRRDFDDRVQHLSEALGIQLGYPPNIDPARSDFQSGVLMWPMLQALEELTRRVRALEAKASEII